MNPNSSQRSYLRAAVQEASPAGLVVILYDLLVEDLQRAIAALRRDAIEERSRHLKHALLVLQLLDCYLDLEHGGAAAGSLSAFYSHLRAQLLHAQFRSDPAPLERQIALVLDVREAWQAVDANPSAKPPVTSPAHSTSSAVDSSGSTTHSVASWSA